MLASRGEELRVCETDEETTMHRHEDPQGGLARLPELAQPILQFDLATEIEHLRLEDSWQRGTGRSSRTLVKQPDFRIVLVAMKSATEMKEHRTDGRISIHTILGHLRLKLPSQAVEVRAGHLLALDPCIVHDVEALEDSVFLLTISWPMDQTRASEKEGPTDIRASGTRG
jgi:quercetin dioxygenase-like cupin family protein